MKNYLPWPQCYAADCAHQGKRGKLKLCLADPQKECQDKDRLPYGRYDLEDIFWPNKLNEKNQTDSC